MEPSNFPQSNVALNAPAGMTADECEPLCVYRGSDGAGRPVVISCWKPTADELAEIQRTGRVWLFVHGHSMPPVIVTGEDPWEVSRGE